MIIFDRVTKQFGESVFALQDVSFQVEPGEFLFITGPSGSGKTTLMRLLTREYTPTSGEIMFASEPLSQIRSNQVHHHRRRIGMVFQDYKLLPELNVWENIALALNIIGKEQPEIEQRVTDLLDLVNLTEKAFLFPSQISGGEAQRVGIARALATAPAVIFADEPTGNLDPDTSLEIAKLLKKINELGTTILVATHDVTVLDHLKDMRTLRLRKGELIEDTHAAKKPKSSSKHPTTTAKETPTTEEDDSSESEAPALAHSKPSFIHKIWPFGKPKVISTDLESSPAPKKKPEEAPHHFSEESIDE